jgi:hypothetical protein
MNARQLRDRIAKGLGVEARKVGSPYTVYRPKGAVQPISPHNRVIILSAFFRAEGGGPGRAPDYGKALWSGSFDSSYTQPGDYLAGYTQTYFVATQQSGLPIQCVLTNRVVTMVRPVATASGGYSGFYATSGEIVIDRWPASLLEDGGHAGAVRPNETRFAVWTILLPALPVAPLVADVITDDLGATYVVAAAEQSLLGWRLLVRQIGA